MTLKSNSTVCGQADGKFNLYIIYDWGKSISRRGWEAVLPEDLVHQRREVKSKSQAAHRRGGTGKEAVRGPVSGPRPTPACL